MISKLSTAGQKVFDARYAQKDDTGQVIETFEQAVHRLAKTAASVEKEKAKWEKRFADIMGDLFFIPSTPIWANVGKPDRPWQPGACFVLAVEDSLESMYQTLKDTALVFKSGGGVGYNFSTIRPKGSLVRSTKGQASGVVELIKLYDASSSMVMQGGVRRGASMGLLDIDHPEIEDFINAKLDGSITNFNLSVGITDRFMEALHEDMDWDLIFGGQLFKTVKAKDLWEQIAKAAHQCGDPGLIFLDRLQDDNPVPSKLVNAVNPCGEQILSPGESCLLGSINLAKAVSVIGSGQISINGLRDIVYTAIRFLDNMIDVAQYPLDFIAQETRATRKVGLGYTGLHDMLINVGIPYDSKEGREFAGSVAQIIQKAAHEASQSLAQEKGCFFDWGKSVFYPYNKRRNAACITVAPTGSVTTIAGCEGYGIEPIFAVAYSKTTNVAGAFDVFSPLFQKACAKQGVPETVMNEVAQKGSCQGVKGIPAEIADIFKGAQDIKPKDHILMQAEIQKHVDNAVSKTINLPGSATSGDIDLCYRKAHELNLKGITVFRDGSKPGTITVGEKKEPMGNLPRGSIAPRPVSAHGSTHCLNTGCGKIYLTVNHDQDTGAILETFITTGSDGGCMVYTEATSRLISLAIRGGIGVDGIVEQLLSTHACPAYMLARGQGKKVSPGRSCASAIARKLAEISAGGYHESKNGLEGAALKCELCGQPLKRAEGCLVCLNCGFSKC